MFGDPVSNPRRWGKKRLVDVCIKLNDGTHFSPNSFETGEYKYITAKNIKPWGFDFSNIITSPMNGFRHLRSSYGRQGECRVHPSLLAPFKGGRRRGYTPLDTLNDRRRSLGNAVAKIRNGQKRTGKYCVKMRHIDDQITKI